MSKNHLILIGSSVLFFLLLYLGFDVTPPDRGQINKQRSITMESTSIGTLLAEAREELSEAELGSIKVLEIKLDNASDDSTRVENLKSLSGAWYRLGRPGISGFYAEEVAKLEKTPAAWSIAGSTYNYGLSPEVPLKIRKYCAEEIYNYFCVRILKMHNE